MADFRTKLIGLTGIALAFAGMANAQSNCNAGVAGVVSPYAVTVPQLRAEGLTELVGDVTFTCPASLASASTLTLTVNGTTSISSKTGVNSNTSEVALVINGGAPVYGTVSGSSVSFTYTPPAGGFTASIQNVRVNATTLPTGSTPVTENIVANTGSISMVATGVTVGFVSPSLKAPSLTKATGTAPSASNPTALVACTGNSATGTFTGFNFSFDIAEAFTGAFKTVGPGAGTETGPDGSASVAASGTRFTVTISNIPTGATAYLPSTITNAGLTLTAINSPTATPYVAVTPATPGGSVPVFAGGNPTLASGDSADTYGAAFAPSTTGGVATAWYEVTASVATVSETANVPVFLIAKANAITVPGTVTVVLGYTQTGTIPNFAATTLASLSGNVVGLCNTTLLFPYVTTLANYETGIAISNTSADPFGALGASAQTGTCTMSFYGTTNLTTPVSITGVLAPNSTTSGTANAIPSGQTTGFAVSQLVGGPGVNFDGYAIAQCAFQYGHAMAYLLGNATTPNSSTAMGYLALVIQDPTETGGRKNGLAISESLNN